MQTPKHELAIVIPAFKARFFAQTLQSLNVQTDNRFRIYVGDDASPEDIAAIVGASSLPRNQIEYHRFSLNLGSSNLVEHWKRCVELTTEPWIWLFSDDDIAEPTCVEEFYRSLSATETKYNLYRFDCIPIDRNGSFLKERPIHIPEQGGWDFIMGRLARTFQSTMQEVVFRRSTYLEIGGFPSFPKAWHADDAFIFKMCIGTPMRKVDRARVYWRSSGINISSPNVPGLGSEKLQATMEFTEWLLAEHSRQPKGFNAPCRSTLLSATRDWAEHRACVDVTGTVALTTIVRFSSFYLRRWGKGGFRILFNLLRSNLRHGMRSAESR